MALLLGSAAREMSTLITLNRHQPKMEFLKVQFPKYSLTLLSTGLLIGGISESALSFNLINSECGGANFTSSDGAASLSAQVINSVPAYNWYRGCGPTAAASIIGYWDLSGYPNLFDARENDVFFTVNVQDQISSPARNAKYDPTPDAPGPIPPFTSIADWFQTSVDPLPFGWSYLSFADDAFTGYANFRGSNFEAQNKRFSSQSSASLFNWDDLVLEIDSNRPLMFLVDTDGNGSTDHFVPILGYDDRGSNGKFYGLYTTWSEAETIVWKPFQDLGNPWGVGYATFVRPINTIPEPTSILSFLTLGSLGAAPVLKRQLKDSKSTEE